MTAQELRKLADQIQQRRSELFALRHARSLVEAERDYLTGKIATLAARLDTLVPRASKTATRELSSPNLWTLSLQTCGT